MNMRDALLCLPYWRHGKQCNLSRKIHAILLSDFCENPECDRLVSGNKLDLEFYDQLADLDVREFIDSSEWQVMSTSAEYNRLKTHLFKIPTAKCHRSDPGSELSMTISQ